nr:RNA polymerase I termination factor [Tanacetum cinerariifolium]
MNERNNKLKGEVEAREMRKTREDADAGAVTMENKSENTKSEISDRQGVGGSDGNIYLATDCSLLKEKKGRKHSEKKKTTTLGSKEDRPHKGTLVNDGDVMKKDKKKRRKRDSSEKTQTEEIDDNQNDGAELSMEDNSKVTKEKKKTTESVENNNGTATAKAKGKGKSKKVSFAGHVEVFPSSDREPKNQSTKGDARDLVDDGIELSFSPGNEKMLERNRDLHTISSQYFCLSSDPRFVRKSRNPWFYTRRVENLKGTA